MTHLTTELRPCLALHGFTGGGRDFEPLASQLPGLVFDAPDLPGHGPNGFQTEPFSFDSCAEEYARLVEPQSVLLGYSLGARLALRTALFTQPSALILIGGTPGIRNEQQRLERQTADRERAGHIERVGATAFLEEWSQVPIIATQARASQSVRTLLQSVRARHTASGLAAALRAYGTGSMLSLWDELPYIACPTLLIVGAEDQKFIKIAAEMLTRLPNASLAPIDHCGHAPHFEDPSQVGAVIRRFLDTLGHTL